MSDHADVIPFHRPHPPSYCGTCHNEVRIPTNAAWPQACPHCRATPFVSTSRPNLTVTGGFAAPTKEEG